MKKVYFIYKNDKINSPHLYAITDKKELKKSFLNERKKSLFIVKERELNKDEFNEIMKKHSSYMLGRRGFETKFPSSYNSLKNVTTVYLTATDYEEMDVFTKTDNVILELSKYTDEESEVFNDKLLKALDTIMYFYCMQYGNTVVNSYNYFLDGIDVIGSMKDFKIDELGVFIYLFGNTLKGR